MKKILFMIFALGMIAMCQAKTTGLVCSEQPTCIVQPAADAVTMDIVSIDTLATEYTCLEFSLPANFLITGTGVNEASDIYVYKFNYVQPSQAEGVFIYKIPSIPIRPALSHELHNYKYQKNISPGLNYRT